MKTLNMSVPINQMGYGIAASNLLVGLTDIGLEPSLFPIGEIETDDRKITDVIYKALHRAETFDYQAPTLRIFHQFSLAESYGRGLRAAYPFFETTILRANEIHHLNSLDILFLPSEWAKSVCEANGVVRPKKVVCNCGVDTSIFHPGVKATDVGAGPNTTVFLNMGKCEIRKGIDKIGDMFNRAFTPDDDVLLVMHVFNPLKFNGYDGVSLSKEWAFAYMQTPMGKAGKIKFTSGRLANQSAVASLMASSDAGIFPARAEGWNLDASELMAMGRPCIITNYSAHQEFCNVNNSYLIEIEDMETAYDGFFFDGLVGDWAKLGERQIEQGVHHLKTIHQMKQSKILKTPLERGPLFARTWADAAREIATELGLEF